MGASCELWYYPRQPTGAGIPGAREVSTEYRNSRRQPRSCKTRIEGVQGGEGGATAAQPADRVPASGMMERRPTEAMEVEKTSTL